MVALPPTYDHEADALRCGARLVAGVDEAGRGPLAGPVVAAAVILDQVRIPDGIADSKALARTRRDMLFEVLLQCATVSIAVVSAAQIDRINIRQATLTAMRRAVQGLACAPCRVLVDGSDRPVLDCNVRTLVGGDAVCLSIAAASIVAKVARDRIMERLSRCHPGYGFDAHKGYGTRAHLDALERLGPCPAHRRSFSPVAQLHFALSD
jgi:ribonuclease HII